MLRFWSLVEQGRLTDRQIESFLDALERPHADKKAESAQQALRTRLADAGEDYPRHLVPQADGLTVRLSNVLMNQQFPDARGGSVRTISELVAKTEKEVMGWQNFGSKCLRLLQQQLAKSGLRLGMSQEEIGEAFLHGQERPSTGLQPTVLVP